VPRIVVLITVCANMGTNACVGFYTVQALF
jgi:hypothetical protein